MVRKITPPAAFVIQRKSPAVPKPGKPLDVRQQPTLTRKIQAKATLTIAPPGLHPRPVGSILGKVPRAFVIQASAPSRQAEERKEPTPQTVASDDDGWKTSTQKRKQKSPDLEVSAIKKRAAEELEKYIAADTDTAERTYCVMLNSRGNLIAKGKSGKNIHSPTIIGAADNPNVRYQMSCAEPHAVADQGALAVKNSYSLAYSTKSRRYLRACRACKQTLATHNITDLYFY